MVKYITMGDFKYGIQQKWWAAFTADFDLWMESLFSWIYLISGNHMFSY